MTKALAILALGFCVLTTETLAQNPTPEQQQRFEEAVSLLVTGQTVDALAQLETLGDEGHGESLFLLGLHYAPDLQVPLESLLKGIEYLSRASELGNLDATTMVAIMYLEERDGLRDEKKSREFFLRAAEQHQDSDAYFMLGRMSSAGIGTQQNFEEAANWYLKAAEQGSPNAMNALGVYHREGIGGLEKNPEKSFAYFREAASVNLPDANFQLAEAYRLGVGTEIDYQAAVENYRKAASKNHTEAAWYLALALATGNGARKDLVQAHVWCGFAQRSEVPPIQSKAKSCLEELTSKLSDRELERSAQASQRIDRGFQSQNPAQPQGFILNP